jgi:hypothetical protein
MGVTGPACFGFERRWLSKALRHIPGRADLFQPAAIGDAQYLLGLGNRQVLALEYWLRCLGLIERVGSDKHRLSPVGTAIRLYDPQFEERGTWFALHYSLASDEDGASTYWYAVNHMPERFDRDQLHSCLAAAFPGKRERTYQDASSIFCSILNRTPIGTLMFSMESGHIAKIADAPHLPDAVLLFCLARWFQSQHRSGANIVELSSAGAPGRVFGLSDFVLRSFLDRAQDYYAKRVLWWSQTAGLDSISLSPDVPHVALLRAHYLQHLDGLSPLDALDKGIEEELRGGNGIA